MVVHAKKCVELCEYHPGWMTVKQAKQAVEAGFATKLMLDWFEYDLVLGNNEPIYVLTPAVVGFEGKYAPEINQWEVPLTLINYDDAKMGVCTFLTNKLCAIHHKPFKPIQCQQVYGCSNKGSIQKRDLAREWWKPAGLHLVARWQQIVGVADRDPCTT